jgi:hypothetical protein
MHKLAYESLISCIQVCLIIHSTFLFAIMQDSKLMFSFTSYDDCLLSFTYQ